MSNDTEDCCVCGLPVEGKDKEFSEDQEQHPGILGEVHPKCYEKACKEEPDLPWKDPISGEVDFQSMGEELGIWPATEEDLLEEEYYG